MKRRYRISTEPHRDPTDDEIARYRDPKKLLYNYHKAVHRPAVPLYKDPKAFIAIVLIVLLAYFITEVSERRGNEGEERPAPTVNDVAP